MPPVTGALLGANILVFVLQLAGVPLLAEFALWPPASGPRSGPGFEPWQLVTYAFLHGSLLHIGFNMLALYAFGRDVERLFGSAWYLQYYLVCVITAALSHLAVTSWMGAPAFPTVGASGGVYGLLLAYGVYFPRRTVILLFPPIPLPARVFVMLFAAIELYFGVTGTASGIAHFAHLGGMLGGWLLLRTRRRRRG
ncbi:MAG: rhomboid family intramembrane serine protease [Betaproteobacteria bacterium]|nr:rhomboid family intramembrane serine protease [Betaproteobacteria bacterium]MDH5221769.1 rhomboid family intramembrane serine protease [Betaproteobacteria bacterium]